MSSRLTRSRLALALLLVATLTGCGAALRHQPLAVDSRAVSAQPSQPPSPATDGKRLFSANSVWNRPLAPDAPLDASSTELVENLNAEVAKEQTSTIGPWINTTHASVPIYIASAHQRTVRVRLEQPFNRALKRAWRRVPLPAGAQPAAGSDADLVVWQPSTDRLWEFWRLTYNKGWSATWGGAINHVSTDPGVYTPSAWPGAQTGWGVSATSLSIAGGLITLEDLQHHQINHALALAIPDVRKGIYTTPAQRSDGRSTNPQTLPEGAHLRIDPNLNLNTLHLPPITLLLAQAAQRYGILIRDYSPNIAFYAQDPTPTTTNPYTGPTGYLEGKHPNQLLTNFPWNHLQLLKMNIHQERLRPRGPQR